MGLMTTLVLETSTERGVLAVFNGDVCLFEEQLSLGLHNSHLLLPKLHEKMDALGFQLSELTAVVVGVGPGSYTGIRMGAIVAKTLAFAYRIPLIGICTLEAFIPEKDGRFAVVIDAKIGGAYMQKGERREGTALFGSAPQAYSLEETVKLLQGTETIVTPSAEKIRPKLESLGLGPQCSWLETYPSAAQMMKVAAKKKGVDVGDASHLDLLYLRKTQAEIEKERNTGI